MLEIGINDPNFSPDELIKMRGDSDGRLVLSDTLKRAVEALYPNPQTAPWEEMWWKFITTPSSQIGLRGNYTDVGPQNDRFTSMLTPVLVDVAWGLKMSWADPRILSTAGQFVASNWLVSLNEKTRIINRFEGGEVKYEVEVESSGPRIVTEARMLRPTLLIDFQRLNRAVETFTEQNVEPTDRPMLEVIRLIPFIKRMGGYSTKDKLIALLAEGRLSEATEVLNDPRIAAILPPTEILELNN